MVGKRERWSLVRALFEEALEMPHEQRVPFVHKRCGRDAELAEEVLRLVKRETEIGGYLEPVEIVAQTAREIVEPEKALVGEKLGDWRLERVLGSGGMGTVHLAHREGNDFQQRGAVKLLRRGFDGPEARERFRRERRLLAQLEHQSIARLLDGGIAQNGQPFIVMEYVEGRPIDVWCNERQAAVRERLVLFAKVCAAVHHAHQRLVVHRDIKPANVLVDANGEPKLLDFGLAKMLGDEEAVDVTRTGARALTPAYASPEQLRGEAVTTASDVYSLGVVLYQLLTGRLPHPWDGESIGEMTRRVSEVVPPRPSEVVRTRDPRAARELRGDLDAIVLQALRKEPERRYPSALALAEDLERRLDGRAVSAQPESLVYLTRTFVRRHRALVATALVAFLAIATGLVVSSRLWLVARERASEVTRLSDVNVVRALAADADMLWPAVPEAVPKMDLWLGLAERLVARRPLHEARLAELRASAREVDGVFEFDANEAAWEHEILVELTGGLAALASDGPLIGSLGEMRRRRAFAAGVDELTVRGAEAAAAWSAAQAAIAASSRYGGLDLAPQRGLLPLGPDPVTGLWEFWQPQTGARPERGADGRFVITSETALVFVLLPGGPFLMGSPDDEERRGPEEGPRHEVTLAPFFASKYELTQAQFARITGANPAILAPGTVDETLVATSLVHPVEGVSWSAGRQWLDRAGLDYPTEAQWEYLARAGTTSPWSSGDTRESLRGHANLADASAAARGQDWLEISDWPEHDDGFAFHAPVGSFAPNGFGLHDVHGNVCEWCDDAFGDYATPPEPGDGRRTTGYVLNRPIRGGGFSNAAHELRSAKRVTLTPDVSAPQIGLRPVRRLS
jgi:formylglycine-generating enzyme required for sulfatase activity/tRNA A-37 threonylcarbamoyl transferase component Bud32